MSIAFITFQTELMPRKIVNMAAPELVIRFYEGLVKMQQQPSGKLKANRNEYISLRHPINQKIVVSGGPYIP